MRPSLKLEPKTHVASAGYVFTAAGLIIALFPGLIDSSVAKIAIIVLCVLVALASLIWSYISGNLFALYRRMRDYPQLHEQRTAFSNDLDNVRQDLDTLRQHALELMISNPYGEEDEATSVNVQMELLHLKKKVVELAIQALTEKTFYINREGFEEGKLVIALEDSESSLDEGDKVLVVDTADFYEMGTFEVVEKRQKECYAVGGADVDGLWLQRLRQTGEKSMIVQKVAILVTRGDE